MDMFTNIIIHNGNKTFKVNGQGHSTNSTNSSIRTEVTPIRF